MSLHARDPMPMFTVTSDLDEASFAYASVWQRNNLLLVCLRHGDSTSAPYTARLVERSDDFRAHDVKVVVTQDTIPGIPSPGVVVADRWGEIHFIQAADRADALPAIDELLEWLRFVQIQCPECQGETR
jgi:hypothetical protein